MILPENVQRIISEYSKPVTHPLWKNRKWISIENIYREIKMNTRNVKVYNIVINHIQNGFHWATLFSNYEILGLKYTSLKYDIPIHLLYVIVSI